jgi:cyclohexadieny/prephenate dehydrogenase
MSDAPFATVAIIGIGLIGSSIARAVRAAMPDVRITLGDVSADVVARGNNLRLGDNISCDLSHVVQAADLVILCTPVGTIGDITRAIAPSLKAGAVLSDVGSVKAQVIAQVMPHLPPATHFIGGHPVAGTEKSGPDAGFAGLFHNRWCILTPLPECDAAALARLTRFWQLLGAKTEIMDAAHHDLVLAVTSHVPHLIAYTIVGTASDLEGVTQSEVIKYSAGGFRDFTRIAASDPTMWRDVFLSNKDAVLEILQRLSEDITMLQRAIRWDQGDVLFDLFTRTRAIRRSIIDAGQDTDTEDFGRPHD